MLVAKVEQAVGKAPKVLDLYCGNGNLTLGLPAATKVLGIDHNGNAVRAAARLRKGSFRPGGEEEMLNALRKDTWDVVVLDPPRSGAKLLAPALASCEVGKLVYVSCDPATLARDLRVLCAGGWRAKQVTALDLFPNTAHVETVCVLERG
jgi:23S rRNA (uracil1939-C5)-methyltransferase